ncbi:MAG: 30S ribosomal protein S17e [Thermofilaceae archaeon]
MGKVRPAYIKNTGRILVEKYPDKFTIDFEHNKKAVSEILKTSKKVRNRVAGYITRLMKIKFEAQSVEQPQ